MWEYVCELHYSENSCLPSLFCELWKVSAMDQQCFLCSKMQGTILLLMVGFHWNEINFVWTTNHSDLTSLFRLNLVKNQPNVEQL